MEPRFQTSFIPKKPIAQPTESRVASHGFSTSIIFLLGLLLFIASLILALGSFGAVKFFEQRQVKLKSDLQIIKKDFKLEDIRDFKQIERKISLAKEVLNNHVALSQIFDPISKLTAQNIRFTTLDVSAPTDRSKGVTMKMTGFAPGYEALAFQSDQLGLLELYGLRNIVINPAISNPVQTQSGLVSFDFSANVQPQSMLYKNSLQINTTE
jgi:hypothetical protein